MTKRLHDWKYILHFSFYDFYNVTNGTFREAGERDLPQESDL